MRKNKDRTKCRGVTIETLWGDASGNRVSQVDGRLDLFHIVRITNQNSYPVSVVCVARILADPRKLKFVSPRPTDSEERWIASAKLSTNGTCDFNDVGLQNAGNAHGSETVEVDLRLTWASRYITPKDVHLSLNVTV